MKRYPESRAEIRSVLQHMVDGRASSYELDDCFSGSFTDPKLESMRQRLWKLPDEFPPTTKGAFCGKDGIEVMRLWIAELSDEDA